MQNIHSIVNLDRFRIISDKNTHHMSSEELTKKFLIQLEIQDS